MRFNKRDGCTSCQSTGWAWVGVGGGEVEKDVCRACTCVICHRAYNEVESCGHCVNMPLKGVMAVDEDTRDVETRGNR